MDSTDARSTTINPAPGPFIATLEPRKKVQKIPPIADATIPAIGGNPDATARASAIGSATSETLIPAMMSNRSFDELLDFRVLFKLIKIIIYIGMKNIFLTKRIIGLAKGVNPWRTKNKRKGNITLNIIQLLGIILVFFPSFNFSLFSFNDKLGKDPICIFGVG